MYLSTNVRYDTNKEELYLVDLSIDKILDENGKEVADSSEAKMLKSLLSNYIETTPVYKYGEEYEDKNKDRIKKHVKIPVIGVSKIKKESQASWLVENNLLDFVAVGKAMISQDKWMEKARKDFMLKNRH